MNKRLKNEKGITLIALIITIIILIILAGVTIATLTGENGLLKNASNAKEKAIKAQYEEELNLIITTIRADAMYNNEEFNMNYIIKKLPEYLEAEGKTDYTWETNQTLPEGEYKGYSFYIDKEYVAHIDGKAEGTNPEIKVEVITTEYVGEGNTIEIRVTANITEGTVTIIAPENMEPTSRITEEDKNKVYQNVGVYHLEHDLDKLVKEYSLGMRYKLFLCVAFSMKVEMILLDEPFSSLDNSAQKNAEDMLKSYVNGGGIAMIATHIEEYINKYKQYQYNIEEGKLVYYEK